MPARELAKRRKDAGIRTHFFFAFIPATCLIGDVVDLRLFAHRGEIVVVLEVVAGAGACLDGLRRRVIAFSCSPTKKLQALANAQQKKNK